MMAMKPQVDMNFFLVVTVEGRVDRCDGEHSSEVRYELECKCKNTLRYSTQPTLANRA